MGIRVGVCGTSFWAQTVHAAGFAQDDAFDLVSIYGRNRPRLEELSGAFKIASFEDFDAFLKTVDAVSLAVPPALQPDLAERAARAGKHLLLEKPLARTEAQTRQLLSIVKGSGVSAMCFLTRLFVPDVNTLIAAARQDGALLSGTANLATPALLPESPFSSADWRHDTMNAMWDAAPHGLSVLLSVLGPVSSVRASAGEAGVFTLQLTHAGGASSTVSVDQAHAGPVQESYSFVGRRDHVLPGLTYSRPEAFRAASKRFAQLIASGASDSRTLELSGHIASVLDAAERSHSDNGARHTP